MRTIVTALVSSALIPGCASIGGLKQAVSVDSTPRHQTVELKGAKPPDGRRTPYFTEIERSSHLDFVVNNEPQEVDCKYRWTAVLLGNAPLAIIPVAQFYGIFFLAAVGFDTITGGSWECPSHISVIPKTTSSRSTSAPPCDRALVIPVGAEGPQEAAELEWAWNQRPKSSNSCIKLVSHGEADGTVARQGFTELDSMDDAKQKLGSHGNGLGLATGASHFVLVERRTQQSKTRFFAEKIDAHTLKTTSEEEWGEGQLSRPAKRSGWSTLTAFGSKLIPNSLGVVASTTNFQRSNQGVNPTIASHTGFGATLTTVSHPEQYATWDFVMDVSPSLGIRLLQFSEPSLPNVIGERRYRLVLGTGDILGTATAHTPVGAVGLGLGIGGFALNSKDREARTDGDDWGAGLQFRFSYSLFLSERVFFETGVHSLKLLSHGAHLSPHREFDQLSLLTLTLGVHVPEFPMWVGRLLSPLK